MAAILAVGASGAAAQPGSLDAAYGSGGYSTVSSPQPSVGSVATDGSVVEASTGTLIRFTSSGVMDRTFGSSGTATGGAFGVPAAVVIEGDGDILVLGNLSPEPTAGVGVAVERFSSSGLPDPSFGSSGIVTVGANVDAVGTSIAVDSQGRIVVAGRAYVGGVERGFLARLTSSGTLDLSFAGGSLTIAGRHGDTIADGIGFGPVAIAPGDSILTADEITEPGTLRVYRFTNEGQADPTFGNEGVAAFPIPRPGS